VLIGRALTLAPNSPEAHFALGLFFYFGHRQYENTLAEFNRTLELQPDNALGSTVLRVGLSPPRRMGDAIV
jgi:lipoprotein NlpI